MVPEKNIDKLAPKPTNPKTGNGIEDIIENLLQQKRLDRSNLAELEQLLRKGEALSFKYDTAKKKFALTQGGLTQYYHRILNPKLNNQLRQGWSLDIFFKNEEFNFSFIGDFDGNCCFSDNKDHVDIDDISGDTFFGKKSLVEWFTYLLPHLPSIKEKK